MWHGNYFRYSWTKNGKPYEWQVYEDRISQQPGRGTLVITSPRDEDIGIFHASNIPFSLKAQLYISSLSQFKPGLVTNVVILFRSLFIIDGVLKQRDFLP